MENAAQSPKPDARIIRLRTPEAPSDSMQDECHVETFHRYTLEYIDLLLDDHFK